MIRSSEYDKLELKHKKIGFYKLIVCIIKKKMSWCETEMQKYMPLVKQDVMKFEVFILGEQIGKNDSNREMNLRVKPNVMNQLINHRACDKMKGHKTSQEWL